MCSVKVRVSLFLCVVECLQTLTIGSGLKCWKCISHDCERDPAKNDKAKEVQCQEGQKCMIGKDKIIRRLLQKARYRMFDNHTHYDSTIRTCTTNQCVEGIYLEDFYKCVATPRQYMISGCTLRSCCDDKDLCNSTKEKISNNLLVGVLSLFAILHVSFE